MGPDKRCPQCKGFIIGEPVVMKSDRGPSREYCSSNCLLDAYEASKTRAQRKEKA